MGARTPTALFLEERIKEEKGRGYASNAGKTKCSFTHSAAICSARQEATKGPIRSIASGDGDRPARLGRFAGCPLAGIIALSGHCCHLSCPGNISVLMTGTKAARVTVSVCFSRSSFLLASRCQRRFSACLRWPALMLDGSAPVQAFFVSYGLTWIIGLHCSLRTFDKNY